MSLKRQCSFAVILCYCVCFLIGSGAAFAQQATQAEKTTFSAEEKISNPVEIPRGVWQILLQDPIVKDVLNAEGLLPDQLPRQWFQGAAIHLHDQDEQDLVVQAGGHLSGANMTNFWVFRKKTGGYELVLSAPAHDLLIRPTSKNGLHDISLVALTGTRILTNEYRFDAIKYQLKKSSDKPIRH